MHEHVCKTLLVVLILGLTLDQVLDVLVLDSLTGATLLHLVLFSRRIRDRDEIVPLDDVLCHRRNVLPLIKENLNLSRETLRVVGEVHRAIISAADELAVHVPVRIHDTPALLMERITVEELDASLMLAV